LAPTAFSETAAHALRYASALAERFDAHLLVIYADTFMPAVDFFFFKQKTAYEIGLGIPAEPLFRSLPQLDINNTIDHRPEGDEKWFLENEKTVTQFCRQLAAERPLKDIRDEYNYPKKKGIKDECSRLLEAS